MLVKKIRDYFYSDYDGIKSSVYQDIVNEIDSIQVDTDKFSADSEQRKKQIILNHILAFNDNGNRDEIESAIMIINEIKTY